MVWEPCFRLHALPLLLEEGDAEADHDGEEDDEEEEGTGTVMTIEEGSGYGTPVGMLTPGVPTRTCMVYTSWDRGGAVWIVYCGIGLWDKIVNVGSAWGAWGRMVILESWAKASPSAFTRR